MLPDKVEQILQESIVAEATHGYKNMLEIAPSRYTYQKNIREVIIPEGVEVINQEAFFYCVNLEKITLPASLRYVNYDAFKNCKRLRQVFYSGSQASWDKIIFGSGNTVVSTKRPFFSTAFWQYNVLSNGRTIELTKYVKASHQEHLEIPESYDGYTVVALGEKCLHGMDFKTVSLPSTLIRIGKEAFSYCLHLESITIPDSVKLIQEYAFYSCSALREVILDKTKSNLERIEVHAFTGCLHLESIVLPDSLRSILAYAFSNSGLKSLTIPKSVSAIAVGAFLLAPMESISVDPSNTFYGVQNGCLVDIRYRAIVYCPCAKTGIVSIPMGIVDIYNHAFQGCRYLDAVEIPYTVENIGACAFFDCTGISGVNLDFVKSIGKSAFNGCSKLSSIILRSDVHYGASVFESCTGLVSVTVQDGVFRIEQGTFRNCTNLHDIEIPASVERIGYDIFHNVPGPLTIRYHGTESQWESLKTYLDKDFSYRYDIQFIGG